MMWKTLKHGFWSYHKTPSLTRTLSTNAGSFSLKERPSGDRAEVVIIGGGAVGTSIAYHLARLGMKDVVLLEKTELTAGSTWHAAGLTALYNSGINMKKIHYYGINLFPQLQEETKQEINFHRPGSIRLATNSTRMDEFHYQMQRQGWQPAPQKIITPEEVHKLVPLLNMDKILGGLYNPADGHVDPYSLTMAFAKAARKYGAEIYQQSQVTGLRQDQEGLWHLDTSQGEIKARHVVNAAGFWAHEVGAMLDLDLPLVPVHHQYLITSPVQEVKDMEKEFPVLRHLEGSFYLRRERDGLLVGPYEHQSKMKQCEDWINGGVPPGFGKELFQPDLDRLSAHLEVAMNLMPVLRTANIQTVVSGPIMYTPDLVPSVGPFFGFNNLWMAVGFGYGIIHSAGVGRYLAEWMLKGEPPFDLIEADPNRFSHWTKRNYVFVKARETYGLNNFYTYPKEERWAGRPTSRGSQLSRHLIDRGAEMGFHSGWETANWFALEGDTPGYRPSFRRSNWFLPVGRECRMVMERVGLIDLSPFGKFRIRGPDAAGLLDRLTANKLPRVGTANICHMLTPRGRVYAELTVTTLAPDDFLVVTGSGSELHDLRWIEEHRRLWNCEVQIQNVTDDLACLGLAGPKSRSLLSRLTNRRMDDDLFAFLQAEDIVVAGVPTTAIRISYTGELGWELYHDKKHTLHMYKALLDEGKDLGVGDLGSYAVNSLRLEKGFRLWGAEMNIDHDPYEAGLDAFIRSNKETDFIGKTALHRIAREGSNYKLAYLRVDTADVEPEGNESVWCSGKVVGYTTSGAFGYTVNHGVAFSYLPPFLTVPGTELQVEILGELRPATVLPRPPVDTEPVRERKKKKKEARSL